MTAIVKSGFWDVEKYETERWEERDDFIFDDPRPLASTACLHVVYSFPPGVSMSRSDLNALCDKGDIETFEIRPAFGENGISEILTIVVKK